MELYNPSVIRGIKNKYRFKFSRSLGQNFLTNKEVIDGIVEGADITKEDLVIEIGPGIGVLTAAAAEKAGKVIAIEIDTNLVTILGDTLAEFDNVKVINENVLKLNLAKIIEEEARDYKAVKVIGNLPYYITTAIIMKLLEEKLPVESITIMMQKEVADRIKSEPGSRIYGAISVAVQYYCRVNIVEDVPKEYFMPMPKVDSAVLRLDVRKEAPVNLLDEKMFFRCIKAGFSQRRKTLLNSLTGTGFGKGVISKCLVNAGIDGKRRAETLSLSDFAAVANELVKEGKK